MRRRHAPPQITSISNPLNKKCDRYAYIMKPYDELMKQHVQTAVYAYLKLCDKIMKSPDEGSPLEHFHAICDPNFSALWACLEHFNVTLVTDRLHEYVFNLCNHDKHFLGHRPQLYTIINTCLLYTSPSPRDRQKSRMPSSA